MYENGYPAYAGIDPNGISLLALWRRLPRIRGDRPFFNQILQPDCKATPHTRGSTVTTAVAIETNMGYPAYAGIDPARPSA